LSIVGESDHEPRAWRPRTMAPSSLAIVATTFTIP
jgi:hypothetical protein